MNSLVIFPSCCSIGFLLSFFFFFLVFLKRKCLFCNIFRVRQSAKIYCLFPFFLMPSLALLIVLDDLNKSRSPGILGLVIGMSFLKKDKDPTHDS